ncbi:hypothetical protein PGTUg99_021513 [Puccinia graminis f. sp. tritici]|uniref:Tet-like 2OG-Fe(II) oxygenase domain-containing protein n=2 Tax=Puccinia graminis f. sp. tritici TaxID=56615 RepID=A0A5B0PDR6_PUCGR|nr:hypothetical protein PGTUg99_021513 [Puccinia graminis f. sp. tritici]
MALYSWRNPLERRMSVGTHEPTAEPSGGTNGREVVPPLQTSGPAAKPQIRKRCSEARESYRRRRGMGISSHDLTKKIRKLDLFPEISKELAIEVEEALKDLQQYEENSKKYPDQSFPNPMDRTVLPRLPTEDEYAEALKEVQDNFRTIDHGYVRIFDAKSINIICIVMYTKLSDLDQCLRLQLDFLCEFLHGCKSFIIPPTSEDPPEGYFMSAMGWSQNMTRLKILDQYRDEKAIEANREVYDQLMAGSEKAGGTLWNMYNRLASRVAEKTMKHFKKPSGTLSADKDLPAVDANDDESTNQVAGNLAFPTNGFYADHYWDKETLPKPPTAFALVLPTSKSTGQIKSKSEGYQVDHGQLVFPDVKIALTFPPDTVCEIVFQPHVYAHGTMKAKAFGDSSRLGICIQAAPSSTYVVKKLLEVPPNEETSASEK